MSQPSNPIFSPEYDHLRRVLLRARQDAGLTQAALAARLGRSTAHVTLLENGQRRVEILDFFNHVTALGLEPLAVADEVFGGFREVRSTSPAAASAP